MLQLSTFDFPLMLHVQQVKLSVVDRIQPQNNKLATGVENKLNATGNSKLNPLTPGDFSQRRISWTFWRFSGWTLAKLALTGQKGINLQHDSLPFLPLASRFMTFWLGHAHKSKFFEQEGDLCL